MKCYDTYSLKKEWFHIRWSKDYLINQYNPKTSIRNIKLYQTLYENQPQGIKFIPRKYDSIPIYPVYYSENEIEVTESMFPRSNFSFMSRRTNELWIKGYQTNDNDLKKILRCNDVSLIDQNIMLSQEQNCLNS